MRKLSLLFLVSILVHQSALADFTMNVRFSFEDNAGNKLFPKLHIFGYSFGREANRDSISIEAFNANEGISYDSDRIKVTDEGYQLKITNFYANYLKIIAYRGDEKMTLFVTIFDDCEVYNGCFQEPKYQFVFEENKSVLYFQEGLFKAKKEYLNDHNFKLFEENVVKTEGLNLYKRMRDGDEKKFDLLISNKNFSQTYYPINSLIFDDSETPVGMSSWYNEFYFSFSPEYQKIINQHYNKNKVVVDYDPEEEIGIDTGDW